MKGFRKRGILVWTLMVASGAATPIPLAVADVWDVQSNSDNGATTKNELVHGTTQTHDLAVLNDNPDVDFFAIAQAPFASYEIVIDGLSGDFVPGPLFQRLDMTEAVLQTSVPAISNGPGFARAMRFANLSAATVPGLIKIGSTDCGLGCDANDQYTIRMMETTISVARFNNSGSQLTVLLVQNTTTEPIHAAAHFWTAGGTLLVTRSLAGPLSRVLTVLNLATVPELVGQAGHIAITHDGTYGALNVKAVAIEPSTGFSFDTPGAYVGR